MDIMKKFFKKGVIEVLHIRRLTYFGHVAVVWRMTDSVAYFTAYIMVTAISK